MLGGMMIPTINMVPYLATNYGEYALTVSPPGDWTQRSGTHTWTPTADGTSLSGKTLVVGSIGGDVKALTWNRASTSGDYEILALIKRTGGFSGTNNMAGVVRCADDGDNGINFGFRDAGSVEIAEFTSGVHSNGTIAAFSSNTTDKYWLRWQRVTNTHNARVWQYGTAEPSSPTVSRTTSISGANLGIMIVQQNGYNVEWFSMAIGTGFTAPGPSG